jgi:predicted glutamine amidotransferase
MCGIVGFVANSPATDTHRRTNFLMQGLHCDALRGTGGTGIAIVDTDARVEVFKKALAGPDFLQTMVSDLATNKMGVTKIAIGHNRAATIGNIKDKNCHPFHYIGEKTGREIVMVHNGTLNGYYNLVDNGFRHDVDSAYAAKALADSEDIQATLKKIKGWFVLIWWDGREKTFNIARNDNRDIYFIRGKDGSMYYGSEHKMVDWLIDRNGIELPKNSLYSYPREHEWLSWKFSKDGFLSDKYKLVDIKPAKEAAVTVLPRNNDKFYDNIDDKELKELGFLKDEELYFLMKDFDPYMGATDTKEQYNQFGRLHGVVWNAKGDEYPATIHQVRKTQHLLFEKYFKDAGFTVFPVRSQLTYPPNAAKVITIICDMDLTAIAKDVREIRMKAGEGSAPDATVEAVKEVLVKAGKTPRKQLDLGKVVDPVMVMGAGGVFIPEELWKTKVFGGCGNCQHVPDPTEADKLAWINGGPAFLCGACADNNEVRENASLPAKEKVH